MENATSAAGETASKNAQPTEVGRVAIRVPPFWVKNPAVWFHQLEAQFALNGITSDMTKFYYTAAQLESRYADEVSDIISNPPATEKYEALKRELLRRLTATQNQQIRELLERTEMGDQTPSQFLRTMRRLAGDTVPEDFLRTLWAGRLPAMTRAIVTSQADLALAKLAEIADRIHESTAPAQVSEVTTDPTVAALAKQLEKLTAQVCELARSSRSRERFPNETKRDRTRSARRNRSPSAKGTCWYHRRFAAAATKCRKPCNFVAGNGEERH